MASTTARRKDEDELLDEVEELEEEEARPAAPAVSDSRRRRQMKRGEIVPEAVEAPQPARKDRPTPSQREEPVKSRNPVVRVVSTVREFLRETRVELEKVAWPTREETTRLTYIVIAVTVASALFLGFVSLLFSLLTTELATSANAGFAAVIAVVLIIGVAGLWLMRDRLFGAGTD